eukprot:12925141-Ditylum_brightwellii.AAC.1
MVRAGRAGAQDADRGGLPRAGGGERAGAGRRQGRLALRRPRRASPPLAFGRALVNPRKS